MQVHIFRSNTKSTYGFTFDSSGSSLPEDGAPWVSIQATDIEPAELRRTIAASKNAAEAIERDGYFLMPSSN